MSEQDQGREPAGVTDAGESGLGARILSGQGPEFAELLETLGEAVVVRGRDGRFAYANRAAIASLGVDRRGELLGAPLHAVFDRYIVRDEYGRPITADALPSVHLLETGNHTEPLLLQMVNRENGAVSWRRLSSSPLHDSEGVVIAAVTVIEDVTAVKAAEVHTRVLAESGRQLSASLDYEQTLQNVAKDALPGLADWSLVELVENSVRRHVVVAHVDNAEGRLAARLRELEPPAPTAQSALRRVLATGESELYPEVSDEHLQRVAVSADQLEIYRRLEIRSAIVVPMRVAARIIGAMSFFTSTSGRRFTDDDLAVAEQLARRAAVAVENARLYTVLEDVADTLQNSLLPCPVPEVPGWEIGALYRPAPGATRIEVGGDFYEVFDTAGNAFAMIGDVTGHGVRAATVTSLLRHGARFASHLEPDPVAIIRRLDEELRRRADGTMATALCAALHNHSVLLCSAGHPPALVIDRDGATTETPSSGPLLGAFSDSSWHQQRVPVADGVTVLLYTDGVTETVGDGNERFGPDRLRMFAADHAGSAPQALLNALDAKLDRFRGGQPTDDVAALALRPRD
jgi:serine phosphatase RsbU (regulator of sigma subunit)